ncbi:MAG TPA: hypothetical protein VLC53_06500 [Myxococcota bacterium]|nr:hypothetical protein [Myxococcota bacterium]
MSVLVWGVFADGQRARAGVEQLIESSFPPDEIKVLLKDEEGFTDVPMERKTAVPVGAAVGATLGAAGAAGAVLLTGGGALIAAGPVVALFQAAGLGGALGGVAGAMGGLSWWKDEADVPEAADQEPDARVLVLIPVSEGREKEAEDALRRAAPEQVGALGPEAAAHVARSEALAQDPQEEERQQREQRDDQ